MRPELRLRILLLLALLCLPATVAARWYQVEVVVFKHTSDMSTGGEQWPALVSLPDYAQAMELLTSLPELSDEPPGIAGAAAATAGPIAFKALERGERRLADVERRLRNSGEYEPMLAAAWRQPSFGIGGAKRIFLADVARSGRDAAAAGTQLVAPGQAVATLAPRVQGIVTVKVSRLLYVDVDFVYDNAGVPVRLSETRNMKLREIHYFDHPLFGVIVQVSPYVLPGEDPSAPAPVDEPADEAPPPAPQ